VYDEGIVRSGIVTTATPAVPSERLQEILAEHHIAATYTEAGSSRWDVERRGLPNLLRLSVHYTTTPDELEATVEVLVAALREGR
jgi:selenocysteine lyase/cysteine desulfurase